jgi:hypothetical protein
MKKLVLFALTLAAALPFASARPAAAATQENVIAQATGDKQPFALAWADDAQGTTTKVDSQMSQKIAAAFAGATYLITDQHHLLIGQMSGSNLQQVLPASAALDVSNGKGYYVVHLKAAGLYLDGIVVQFSDDPTKGLAVLDLVLINQQGLSESTHIEQSLSWASSQPSPGPSPAPNPFGF